MEDSPLLARRRAMAEILAEVHEVASERYGQSEADSLIAESVKRSAVREGETFAELQGSNSFPIFSTIVDRWTENDALQIDLIASSEDRLEFDVVRCRFAELYRSMGLQHIGGLLSCNRDGTFCQGFNPAIQLTRTQTIMQGASHCDFRFHLSSENETQPVD